MKIISAFLMTLFLCAAATGQQKTDLKLNLEKNKTYRLRSVTEQTIIQTINGNQQTIESGATYVLSLKMVDANRAFMVAEIHIDTLASKTNTMGKTVVMTSASAGNVESKETSDIMSYFMNRITQNPVYAKIDSTGKVIELINSKMLSDMILRDTGKITVTGPTAPALKKQVADLVGNTSLINIIEMFTHYLPGKEVETGDKWNIITTTNAGGMSLDITSACQLNQVSGGLADISVESAIKAAPNAAPMEMGSAKITYDDISGLTKSTLHVNAQTGLMENLASNTHITGNLSVSMPGMSMQIPMDITSTGKINRME